MTRSERESIDHERRKLDGHGDRIRSQTATDAYRDGWERVFAKKKKAARGRWVETISGRYYDAPPSPHFGRGRSCSICGVSWFKHPFEECKS